MYIYIYIYHFDRRRGKIVARRADDRWQSRKRYEISERQPARKRGAGFKRPKRTREDECVRRRIAEVCQLLRDIGLNRFRCCINSRVGHSDKAFLTSGQ